MAWAYTQNFNGLTDGDLSGQDSWAAGVNVTRLDVQGTTTYEGAKAIQGTCIGDTNEYGAYVARTFTAVTDGSVYWAVRWSSTSTTEVRAWTLFGGGLSGSDEFGMIRHYGTVVSILVYSGGAPASWTDIATGLSANTWYVINMELDSVSQNGKYRARVYSGGSWGSFSAWTVARNASTSVDSVRLSCDRGAAGTSSFNAFWDTIQPTDPTSASGPANLKSLDTNLKANIKSYNTNLIANVKSIDTNV